MGRKTGRSVERERLWRGHVESQPASGLSIRGYCRRHGLHESAFYFWRRELAQRETAQRETAQRETAQRDSANRSRIEKTFVPVTVVPPIPPPGSLACPSSAISSFHASAIEIYLADGRRVSVSHACDPRLLTMVLSVLEGRSC